MHNAASDEKGRFWTSSPKVSQRLKQHSDAIRTAWQTAII